MHQSLILYFTDRVWFVRVWRRKIARTSSRPTSSVKAKLPQPGIRNRRGLTGQRARNKIRSVGKVKSLSNETISNNPHNSDKCSLISLACFKRFRCFQTRVNSRENTKSKEAEKDSRLLNSQVHLFEQVSFLQLQFFRTYEPQSRDKRREAGYAWLGLAISANFG